jgi:hypothetical protein
MSLGNEKEPTGDYHCGLQKEEYPVTAKQKRSDKGKSNPTSCGWLVLPEPRKPMCGNAVDCKFR